MNVSDSNAGAEYSREPTAHLRFDGAVLMQKWQVWRHVDGQYGITGPYEDWQPVPRLETENDG